MINELYTLEVTREDGETLAMCFIDRGQAIDAAYEAEKLGMKTNKEELMFHWGSKIFRKKDEIQESLESWSNL